jgi:adenylosuccinate synthase
VAYVNGAGERTNTSPIIEDEARELTAAYKYLPLWEGSVKELRLRKDLPEEANELLTFIERETRTPIVAAGVGPGREQYVK